MAGALGATFLPRGGGPVLAGALRPAVRGAARRPGAAGAHEGPGVAVLCHPHPAFGGTKDVWLLPVLAQALAAAGWWALRFDFRGVGASAGAFGDGTDEVDDVLGAVDHAVGRWRAGTTAAEDGHVPVRAVVGWSFGAAIALHAAVRDDLDVWVGICPPTRALARVPMLDPVPDGVQDARCRRTAVVAEHDAFYPPATVGVLRPHRVVEVPGADHFLFDRDHEVAGIVVEALAGPARAA